MRRCRYAPRRSFGLAPRSKNSAWLVMADTIARSNGLGIRKAGSVKGTKVAPKYRHPKTGETWSGRGGTAGWLAREIKAGKKREDFLIAKPGRKKRAKTK